MALRSEEHGVVDSKAHRHLAEYIIGGVDQGVKPTIFLKNGHKFQVTDASIDQSSPGILTCKLSDESDLFIVIEEIAALVARDPD